MSLFSNLNNNSSSTTAPTFFQNLGSNNTQNSSNNLNLLTPKKESPSLFSGVNNTSNNNLFNTKNNSNNNILSSIGTNLGASASNQSSVIVPQSSNSLFSGISGNNMFNNNTKNNTVNTSSLNNFNFNSSSTTNGPSLFSNSTSVENMPKSNPPNKDNSGSLFNNSTSTTTGSNVPINNWNGSFTHNLQNTMIPVPLSGGSNLTTSYLNYYSNLPDKLDTIKNKNSKLDSHLKQYFLHDIQMTLQSFYLALDSNNINNVFQAFFFNRIPKQINYQISPDQYLAMFHQYNQQVKSEENTVIPFHYSLFLSSIKDNPDRLKYYSTPVYSPQQLNVRLNTAQLVQLNTIKTVIDLNQSFYGLNEFYNNIIQDQIKSSKSKQIRIKEKLYSVNMKLEMVARVVGKANVSNQKEKETLTRLEFFYRQINSDLLKHKLEVINYNSDYAIENKEEKNEIQTELKNKSLFGMLEVENKRKDISSNEYLGYISELKKMSDTLYSSITNSLDELQFIKEEFDSLSKHGKIIDN